MLRSGIERRGGRYFVRRDGLRCRGNLKLFDRRLFVGPASARGLGGGSLNRGLTLVRLFEKGGPFVGQIDLLHLRLHGSVVHVQRLGTRLFGGRSRDGLGGDLGEGKNPPPWARGFFGRPADPQASTCLVFVRPGPSTVEAAGALFPTVPNPPVF